MSCDWEGSEVLRKLLEVSLAGGGFDSLLIGIKWQAESLFDHVGGQDDVGGNLGDHAAYQRPSFPESCVGARPVDFFKAASFFFQSCGWLTRRALSTLAVGDQFRDATKLMIRIITRCFTRVDGPLNGGHEVFPTGVTKGLLKGACLLASLTFLSCTPPSSLQLSGLVFFGATDVMVGLANHQWLRIPLSALPALRDLSEDEWLDYRLAANRTQLRWPGRDISLSVGDLADMAISIEDGDKGPD